MSCLVVKTGIDITPILLLWGQESHLADALFDGLRHVSFNVSRLNSTNGRLRGSAEHASQNGIRQVRFLKVHDA